MLKIPNLIACLNIQEGTIEGFTPTTRKLSDLKGSFADQAAYERALAEADPLIYWVTNIEYYAEEGELSYAIGKIMPGKVGREYYMTKGHYHAWRQAAEIYIGLGGEGQMIMESEDGQLIQSLPLQPFTTVYVPGFTAHRTVNVGNSPLTYIGVYPAQAGHDYAGVATENFRQVLVDLEGKPTLMSRAQFIECYLGAVPPLDGKL